MNHPVDCSDFRFWYENGDEANPGGALTFAQLQEIRKSSLSRTICDNLDDIDVLQVSHS